MKKIFFLMIVFGLITGCENRDVIEFYDVNSSKEVLSSKNQTEKTVTLGFNLVFTGTYDYSQVNDPVNCPGMVKIINNGVGTGTHFGKVTSHFEFCVDTADSSYPNGFEVAYFEDKNGDQLWVLVEGFVLGGRDVGMPNYATSYFKDPFEILGGTGRFEDASGSGWTNDYNSANDPYSHHHWTGKITLIKNKQ